MPCCCCRTTKPLCFQHGCPLAVIVPILLALVFCSVLLGQSQTSFEIIVDAPFTNTNIGPLLEPHIQKPVQIPNVTYEVLKTTIEISKIVCDKIHVGEAWLLTTNGPELWVNISDVRIECHADYSWTLFSGSVTVLAERTAFSSLVLVERADTSMHVSLLGCQADFLFTEADFEGGLSGAMLQTMHSKVTQYLTDTLNSMACDVLKKFVNENFAAASRPSTAQPIHLLVQSQVLSIWGSINELLEIDERLLGSLLLLLSGIWPLLKQFLLLLLWVLPLWLPCVRRTLLIVDLVGKWSMVDILFVGLLMTVLKVDISFVVHATLYVQPHRGVYIYSMAILSSMALAGWIRHLSFFSSRPRQTSHAELLDCAMLQSVEEAQSDAELSDIAEDTDAFLSPFDSPPMAEERHPIQSSHHNPALVFTLILAEVTLTTAGLLLPICQLHRVISVEGTQKFFHDAQVHQYSVFDLAWVMHEEKGDPVLLALQLIFVCFIPLVKWWTTAFLWAVSFLKHWTMPNDLSQRQSPVPPVKVGSWWAVKVLQPWDMREVFLVTLIILCLRVSTWIGNFSQGYAKIAMSPYAMPGFWCCLLAVILDYMLLYFQPWVR